jgi:ribokinase
MARYGPGMPEAEVVVVGSLNQDITVEADRRPDAGETVLGRTVALASGGKGANQAVAAARAGARVAMVGCVGDDAAGEALRAGLRAAGVDDSAVRSLGDTPSGTALIVVDAAGENAIVVVPGANARLSAADVERALRGTRTRGEGAAVGERGRAQPGGAPVERSGGVGPVVLAQLEVPEEAVGAAARAAGRFVLNASPVRPLPAALLEAADPLIVNAGESAAVTGIDSADPHELAAAAHALGVRSIVITLGARGACWSTPDGTFERPAPAVEVVDTTGAGDVFAGTLAARLSHDADPGAALQAAVEAGAAAVGWRGAQEPR